MNRKKAPDFFPWDGIIIGIVVIFIVVFVGSAFFK
jgi:hypothetical protein